MSGVFSSILIDQTPADAVRGLIGAASKQGEQAERRLIERMCTGLDWDRNDVLRLADGTVGHIHRFVQLDEVEGKPVDLVVRLANAVDVHPLALSFRTRMVGMDDMREEDEDKKPVGYRFVMSDALPDRAHDIVEQNWDLDEFKSNPIAPYNHAYWAPAVGKWANVGVVNNQLRGTFIPFRPSSVAVHPMAVMVAEQMEQRVLVTCSVGFRPKAVVARASLDEADPKYGERGLYFVNPKLLECSPTPMPMNPRASRKSVPAAKTPAPKRQPPKPEPKGWAPFLAEQWSPPWVGH